MADPTSLVEYRRARAPRTTVVLELREDYAHLEVGGQGAKLDEADAMRLSNHLKRMALKLQRQKIAKKGGAR